MLLTRDCQRDARESRVVRSRLEYLYRACNQEYQATPAQTRISERFATDTISERSNSSTKSNYIRFVAN